jgi:cytochrome b561
MDDATTLPATAAQSAYGTVAIVLHWSLAVLIVAAFFIGLTMVDLPFSPRRFPPLQLAQVDRHRGAAALAPRVFSGAPPDTGRPRRRRCPRGSSPRFAPPTSSSTDSSSSFRCSAGRTPRRSAFPVVFLGWLPLPDFVARDKAFGDDVLKPLHEAASWLLAAIVVGHVGAAFKHHFVDRDGLLVRMWPWWPSRSRA